MKDRGEDTGLVHLGKVASLWSIVSNCVVEGLHKGLVTSMNEQWPEVLHMVELLLEVSRSFFSENVK